jgi:hypothetical protein
VRGLIFVLAQNMSESKKLKQKIIEKTDDGHYVIIDGRKWRATNPNLPEDERQKWVNELMSARREIGRALKAKDESAEKAARERVQTAKVALGERGPKWWENEKIADSKTEK